MGSRPLSKLRQSRCHIPNKNLSAPLSRLKTQMTHVLGALIQIGGCFRSCSTLMQRPRIGSVVPARSGDVGHISTLLCLAKELPGVKSRMPADWSKLEPFCSGGSEQIQLPVSVKSYQIPSHSRLIPLPKAAWVVAPLSTVAATPDST